MPPIGLLQFALQQAQQQNVDPTLVQNVMSAESGGDPNAVSSAGAIGPMQLMPNTAKGLGVNPRDPYDNIRGGVKYLAQLEHQFGGNPRLVAAAYNAGPGAVSHSLATTGDIPNYPETRAYVQKVAGMGSNVNPDWLEPASGGAAASGAAQGAQAASPATPAKIDPSWLESAAPASSSNAPAKSQPGFLDRLTMDLLPLRYAPQQNLSDLVTGQGGQKNAAGQTTSNTLMSPMLGGLVKGLAFVPELGDRAGAAVSRAMPTWLGGNPNDKPWFAPQLDQWIAEHTAAPTDSLDNTLGQAGNFAGSAVGTGRLVKGAGVGLKALGLTRLGSFLTDAGQLTPGTIPSAITGGFSANAADKYVGQHVNSPLLRTAIDTTAGIVGGAPVAGLTNRMVNSVAPETAAAMQNASEAGVPLQLSDLSSTWQAINKIAGKVPFGNIAGRNVPGQQVTAVRNALDNAAEGYRPNGLAATAGATGTDRFIANDLRQQYVAAKGAATGAENQLVAAAAQHPNLPPIAMPTLRAQAQQLLARYGDTFDKLTVSPTLRKVLGIADTATTPKNSPILQANGTPFQKPAVVSMQEMRDANRELFQLGEQAQKQAVGGGLSQAQVGGIKSLGAAAQQDLQNWLAGAPQDVQSAYANLANVMKTRVAPFREDPRIYSLVSSRTPQGPDLDAQGIYNNLFNTAQGERSAAALNLMSEQGRQAAAYQALKDAADKATSTVNPEGLKAAAGTRALDIEGNPALANIAAAYPRLATDAPKLAQLLQLGSRAAVAASAPKNGSMLVHGVSGLAGLEAAQQLAEHFGPAIGYGAGLGVPFGLANFASLVNRFGPKGFFLANPGTAGQRLAPGAIQGLLTPDRNP